MLKSVFKVIRDFRAHLFPVITPHLQSGESFFD